MTDFVRVRDKATGHQYSLGKTTVEAEPDLYEVLNKPAVDAQGVVLPAKPNMRIKPTQSDEPSESWTVKKIDEYAADRGIELGDASNKAEKLAAIAASQNPNQTPDEPAESQE